METITHELLLLLGRLFQLQSPQIVKSLFIESINSYSDEFKLNEEQTHTYPYPVQLTTIHQHFGYLYTNQPLENLDETTSKIYTNAINLFTGILEKLQYQQRLSAQLSEKEQRISSIFEAADTVSFIMTDLNNKDARILEFSPGAENIFGYTRDEIIGKPVAILHQQKDVEHFESVMQSMRKNKQGFSGEYTLIRKNGEQFPALFTTYPIFNDSGEMTSTLGVTIDISERKRLEESLRESEELLRRTEEISKVGGWEYDLRTQRMKWTDEIYHIHGFHPKEFDPNDIDRNISFYADEDRETIRKAFHNAIENGKAYDLELQFISAQNKQLWIRTIGKPVYAGNEVVKVVGNMMDITYRKQIEEQLQQSEKRYRIISELTSDWAFSFRIYQDRTMEKEWSSGAFQQVTGYNPEELSGQKGLLEIVHPEDQTYLHQQRAEALEKGVITSEYRIVNKTGDTRWIRDHVYIEYNETGQPAHAYITGQDITEQTRARQALKKSQQQLRTLMGNLPGMAYRCKNVPEWTMEFVSEGCRELTEYTPDDLIHDNTLAYGQLVVPEDQALVWNQVQSSLTHGNHYEIEYRIRTLSQKEKWVWERGIWVTTDEAGNQILEGFITDITDRKSAEEQLRKNEEDLKTTLNSIGDAVITTDLEGYIARINPVAQQLTGWDRQEAIGTHLNKVFDIVNSQTQEIVENPVKKVLQTGSTIGLANHTMLISKDGKHYQIADSGAPIKDEQGTVTGVVLAFRNVTEDYQLRQELEEREAKYRTIFESVQNGLIIADQAGYIRDINPKACNLYGYSKKEMRGMHASQLITQDYHPVFEEFLNTIQTTGYFNGETIDVRKDGTRINVSVRGTTINMEGERYMLAVLEDITEWKQTQEALHNALNEANEKQRTIQNIFDTSPNALYVYDLEAERTIYQNYPIGTTIGYTHTELKEEMDGQCLAHLAHPDDLKKIRAYFNEIQKASDNDVYELECRLQNKNGKWHWLYCKDKVYKRDTNGAVQQIIGAATDITEQKLIEEKLRESDERFRTIFNASNDAIFIHKVDTGEVTDVNETVLNLFNCNRGDIKGITSLEMFAANDDASNTTNAFNKIQKAYTEGPQLFEWQAKKKTGETFWVEVNLRYAQILNQDRIIAVVRDITERKKAREQILQQNQEYEALNEELQQNLEHISQLNKELEQAKEQAEESDRLKSAFLANMSHEIRTPMNGIMGFAELLKNTNINADQQSKYLTLIENSGKRMLDTINDLIDISKIEAGQVKIFTSRFNINELIADLYAFFEPEVQYKGLSFQYQTPLQSTEAYIQSDHEKLYAILTNLIKNAIKYTDQGKIEFGYQLNNNMLEFFVRDTGKGIPPDKQPHIFDRFRQADMTTARPYEGSGLGLSISKAYIEMLGGHIFFESAEQQGTVFYFTIPYHPSSNHTDTAETKNELPPIQSKLKDQTVLIVEDNETAFIYFNDLLSTMCKKILRAKTGTEAVHLVQENPVDLIFMDIKLPEMDGYTAIQKIRTIDQNVTIIAQTAYAQKTDHEQALKAGSNDYISKPISKKSLYSVISQNI